MSENKTEKQKKTKAPKDHWFSFSGIRKEA